MCNEAIKMAGRMFLGGVATYFTMRALQKKADELIEEGGCINAFTISGGQAAIAMAAGFTTMAIIK